VIDRSRCPTRSASIGALLALGFGLAGPRSAAIGQDAPARPAPDVAEQVIARLKSACESESPLHGALIQDGELKDGTLVLSGTVDRAEQAGAIEARARRWLDDTPSWKAHIPRGVEAAKLVVLPVRSELLPRLRRDFAGAGAGPAARPGLLQQTRIDDLYFDARGRVRAVGLCINQGAYLAQKNAAANAADDPLAQVAQAIRDRIKGYTLPPGIDPDVLARLQADQIAFEENPVRVLQRWANQSSQFDGVLFRDARFDARGALTVDGLLGDESLRAEAAALLARPEFVKTYARPDGTPPAEPRAAVAPMTVVPWRQELLSGLQRRLAADVNRGAPTEDLRYCRLDRAMFIYPETGGLTPLLRFEGVALRPDDEETSARIATGLRDECRQLFQPPIPVDYNVQARLTKLPNPVRRLQANVAAEPALDGVRLDDLAFGPAAEATFEGLWVGPAQGATLAAVLAPDLAKETENRVGGPLAWRLREVPTDGLLRRLRRRAAAAFDETSLDRLVFRPAQDPTAVPALTLDASTTAARSGEVRAQLLNWLKEDELAKVVGPPEVDVTPRPRSLVAELRRRVELDPNLDGVRIDRGFFDEENALVLSGLQDHAGQAERVVALTRDAAAAAWPKLPPPAVVRAGAFLTFPLRPLLDRLSRSLPYYHEADGVLLNRAYFDADTALVLAGRASGTPRDRPELKAKIKALIGVDPKLVLTTQPYDPEESRRIVGRGIEALAGGNLAGLGADALDQAIFLDPASSIAWYLRGAFFAGIGDRELALRDFGRVNSLERRSPDQRRKRYQALEPFQGPGRNALEELLRSAGTSR
jgi:hypothetical protein